MQPDADKLASLVVGTVKAAQAGLVARVAAVEDGLKSLPVQTVQGERGEKGERGEDGHGAQGPAGEKGDTGAGIGSLLITADGRLVAHLTDGRSLDAGPVPVKEGAPGRDADLTEMAALKSEIVALRAELVALRAAPDAVEFSALIKQMVTDEVAALPPAPAGQKGQDGASVTVADLAPVIAAEVTKAVAAVPVPKDGAPGERGQDGRSVTADDVAPLIQAEVAKAVETLPRPADGEPGAPGAKGQDGHSVTADDVAPLIQAEVFRAVAALPAPLDGEPGARGERGQDGHSLSVEDVAPLIATEVHKAVSALPPAKDGEPGRSIDSAELEAMVAKAVATIPVPKDGAPGARGADGQGLTVAEVEPLIIEQVSKAMAALPLPKDGAPGPQGERGDRGPEGKSVSADDVAPMIQAEVTKAVGSIPIPKDGAPGERGERGLDGKSVTPEDIAPLVTSEVTKAVGAIPIPKDGVGVFGALIDRDGHLVLTLSDGTVKELGAVVGRSVDMDEVQRAIEQQVARIPRPKDGKDGVDGFGFDDYEEVSDGERTITRRFTQGDRVKAFTHKWPALIYRGVWSEGKTYERGDCVTFGGAMWVAKDETAIKPDFTPASAKCWVLAVKEGRRGKDADPVAIEALVNKAVRALPKPKGPR